MSLTLQDIASQAGVNPSTVSRALRGDARVKASTRERILQLVAENGYSVNSNARNLAAGRTNMICLVVASVGSDISSTAADAVSCALAGTPFSFMILVHRNDPEQIRACMASLNQKICDGAILCSPSQSFVNMPGFDLLWRSGFPMICLDQWPERPRLPVVTNDAAMSITQLTECLLKEGMDAAFVDFNAENSVARMRRHECGKILSAQEIPFVLSREELPLFLKKYRPKCLGVYADSPHCETSLEPFFDGYAPKSCIGAMFDSWKFNAPAFFDRIFLCIQDVPAECRYAVNELLKAICGEKIKDGVKKIAPSGIIRPI